MEIQKLKQFIFSISKVFHQGIYALSISAFTTNNLESTKHCCQRLQVTYNSLTIPSTHKTSGTKKIPRLPVGKGRIFLLHSFKNHCYFSTYILQNYPATKMFFTLIISGITRMDNADDNGNAMTLMDAVCSICQHQHIANLLTKQRHIIRTYESRPDWHKFIYQYGPQRRFHHLLSTFCHNYIALHQSKIVLKIIRKFQVLYGMT